VIARQSAERRHLAPCEAAREANLDIEADRIRNGRGKGGEE
jgi:hypothetical protein